MVLQIKLLLMVAVSLWLLAAVTTAACGYDNLRLEVTVILNGVRFLPRTAGSAV